MTAPIALAATDETATAPAYFTAGDDDVFAPTATAGGHWGADLISGPAVAGLAAWALDRDFGQTGFTAARFSIDLMKPARQVPTQVQTRVLREGRRVRYAQCEILQDDWVVARATMVQYSQSEEPAGQVWTAAARFTAPAEADDQALVVGSDDAGWSTLGAQHQNTSRKRAYYRGADVVEGQPTSPFVRAVIVAEAATNMVVNMGTAGIGYINGDLTLALAREPRSQHLGVQADSHFAADGVSVGTATLFDEAGPIGTATVTSLANPAAQINFTGAARTEAPGAELFNSAGH